MGIPEDKNEENKNKVKEINKKGNEKEEKKKEEKENNKENETKKEEKENNEENKKENKEEIKKEEDTKNTEKEKGNNTEEKNEEKQNEELMNSTFVQKSFIAIIRFVDIKTFKANEFKIYFNFSQFAKFQKMEPFIDKISFLIKFIDINYIKKSVYIDYKSLDCFDVNEWIKDYNKYNHLYLKTMDNKANTMADFHRTSAEYLGMVKNSLIQIEIYTPISLARTINDVGAIKTDKIFMNNNFQDKVVSVEKDDILGLSKIFYDSYEEGQNKKA
jgi:flagellar biosynthesis GTPase FlhF